MLDASEYDRSLAGSHDQLVALQEQWSSFRDLDCEFEAAPFEGGSIQPLIHANCLEDHNRQRIDRLKILSAMR